MFWGSFKFGLGFSANTQRGVNIHFAPSYAFQHFMIVVSACCNAVLLPWSVLVIKLFHLQLCVSISKLV